MTSSVKLLFILGTCFLPLMSMAQFSEPSIKEVDVTLKTYPYSNPREYADFGRMYPYHRFDGYAREGKMQAWRMVVMENDFIKVWIAPEIGGKIWGAVDKKTGKEFLYFNHVVKFRDVSTRGPWTSGGMEMNFGIIGHSPWCSSKVDYVLGKEADGSVSCTIGGEDMSLQTDWRVKITLPKDKAYLKTSVLWYNNSEWEKPFYQWMNAGVKTRGDLEYTYPGGKYLTHDGQPISWPMEQGHQISRYDENDFGHYKSYHVMGNVTDFWGAYWHDDQFGMAHLSPYQDKLGKKIWIWGLSRYGMVWENLLTDSDGQYTEVQSGKLFNQTIGTSYKTPFKHFSFQAGAAYSWNEYWLPVEAIGGIDCCTTDVAYHWDDKKANTLNVYAVSSLEGKTLRVKSKGETLLEKRLSLSPMQTEQLTLKGGVDLKNYEVSLDDEVIYSSKIQGETLSRPQHLSEDFNWNSAYGLYLQGKEFERQNFMDTATKFYLESLTKDAYFAPSLVGLAGIYVAQNRTQDADELVRRALSVNTYDGKANLIFAQLSERDGRMADAVDGYSVAMQSPELASVAAQALARVYFKQGMTTKAIDALAQSLRFSPQNIGAKELEVTFLREAGHTAQALKKADELLAVDPLNFVAHFEKALLSSSDKDAHNLQELIRNEYWFNTYADLSDYYLSLNLTKDALQVVKTPSKSHPVLSYHEAYLEHLMGNQKASQEALLQAEAGSPSLIFPRKTSDETLYRWVKSTKQSSWKADYYLGMLALHFDRYEEAKQHFDACGSQPDFYAYYLVKGIYVSHSEADFRRAIELAPRQFVCYLECAKFLMSVARGEEAVNVLEAYRKYDKENSYINLLLAKALRSVARFEESIRLMKSIVVLPNEGSLEGRNVWRESNLSYAVDLLQHHKWSKAQRVVDDGRMWPENLGVGKPYADSNDERLEDLMSWYILKQQHQDATPMLERMADYQLTMQPNAVTNLLTMVAADKLQKPLHKEQIMQQWAKNHPTSQALHLVEAILAGDWAKADEVIAKPYPKRVALPFEVLFDDRDLDLMIHNWSFFKSLLQELVNEK